MLSNPTINPVLKELQDASLVATELEYTCIDSGRIESFIREAKNTSQPWERNPAAYGIYAYEAVEDMEVYLSNNAEIKTKSRVQIVFYDNKDTIDEVVEFQLMKKTSKFLVPIEIAAKAWNTFTEIYPTCRRYLWQNEEPLFGKPMTIRW